MLIFDLAHGAEFIAGDGSRLRELFHPDKAALQLHYSLAHAQVSPGEKTLPHRLRSAEVYYILSGQAVMHIDRESAAVHAGCAVYIPPGAVQYLENTGTSTLQFLCIVDPPWRAEDEEVFPEA